MFFFCYSQNSLYRMIDCVAFWTKSKNIKNQGVGVLNWICNAVMVLNSAQDKPFNTLCERTQIAKLWNWSYESMRTWSLCNLKISFFLGFPLAIKSARVSDATEHHIIHIATHYSCWAINSTSNFKGIVKNIHIFYCYFVTTTVRKQSTYLHDTYKWIFKNCVTHFNVKPHFMYRTIIYVSWIFEKQIEWDIFFHLKHIWITQAINRIMLMWSLILC